jgi:hypothetical protein
VCDVLHPHTNNKQAAMIVERHLAGIVNASHFVFDLQTVSAA